MENQFSKLLSGRAFVVKSTTPGAPVELSLNPQNEILQDFKILLQPSTILVKDFGFRVLVNGKQFFPAVGSNEVGTEFTGNVSGWSSIPTGYTLESGELNFIMDGPPYDVDFQFYNADAVNDGYVFVWMRTQPKIDLPLAPIVEDAKEKK